MKKNSTQKNYGIYLLFSIVLGLFTGWVTSDLLAYGIGEELLKGLGLWIFFLALLGAFSHNAARGGLHGGLFILATTAGFYENNVLAERSMVLPHIVFLGVSVLIGGIISFVSWHYHEKDWLGAICVAVPVSLMLGESYSIYTGSGLTFSFLADLAGALLLLILLAPGSRKKLMALPVIIVFTFGLVYFNVFARFFGGWI